MIEKILYYVIDNSFNREHYSDIIGEIYSVPPSYAQLASLPLDGIDSINFELYKELVINGIFSILITKIPKEQILLLITKEAQFETVEDYWQNNFAVIEAINHFYETIESEV